MMKTEKDIPQLRFPEFEGEWIEKKIIDIAPLQRGFDLPTPDIEAGDYPVVYSNGILNYHKAYRVKGPGIVTGRSGTIGKVTFVEKDYWPHNTSLWVTEFFNNIPKFIYYLYINFKFDKYNAGSTVPTLNRNDVHQIKKYIPLPPEQQKIASFLSSADQRIQLLTQKKEKLEQYKKGIMQQIFSQQLRFKDENGKDYPDWEEKRLGDVGKTISGLTYNPNDIVENGTLVLRSSNIKNRELNFTDNVFVDVSKFNPVKESDILICVRNGSRNLIGKNALIKKEHENFAFGAFMSIYRSKHNKFIFQFLDTDSYYKNVYKNLGATINSINNSDLAQFKIPFPCKQEQQKIASFLSSLDEKISLVNQQIELTRKWKQGLLQKMFV